MGPSVSTFHRDFGVEISERELELLREVSTAESDFYASLEMLRFGTPFEYITEFKNIAGRRFKVDRRVYVPDDESAHIVNLASETILPGQTIIDVGTGCGWIAISIKLARPGARVIGSDIEAGALDVARENAINHQAEIDW